MDSSLLPFFSPRGVVVVGASTSPEKLGYGVARNLIAGKYQGAIHFVSQKSGELFGRALYTDLAQVPDPVDLAVLVVPSTAMADAIQSCARRGIHAAIMVSAGFREAGPEGAALEKKCLEVAQANQIRLLGPNCIGTIDTHLPLDTTFLQPPMPAKGGIAFVSHSGAFCAAIIDWSRRQGFGFSQIVSLGNQADVNETDILPMVAADEHTRVIVLYMEGVANGSRFVDAAREATRRKPVIALKVGRFASGQKAAASHTGALAASDTAFDAAFAKAGIFRADSAEQMFDWARALEVCPLPRGRNVAVLTNAGGPGVIAADALEVNGLRLAKLSDAAEKTLAAALPPAAGIHNPVDMLASASPQNYADCLKLLLDDSQVDSVMVILPPPPMFATESVADAIIPIIQSSDKPVVVALLGSELTATAFERFNLARVATYTFPERAASALGILSKRAEYLTTKTQSREDFNTSRLRDFMVNSTPDELMAAYGIPTAPIKLARGETETATIATELGFPVVMKIASPDILHKSDIGGVLLNINSEQEARNGYALLIERAKSARPNAKIEGVHIQRQIESGQEVIVGVVRDPTFGPLVMFGSGGVEAEGLKDVAFALGPLSPLEAQEMMRKTWAGKKLEGFRNIPAADKSAVQDILIKLSRLAFDHQEIREIEINPVRALKKGAVAVDVRIKLS
ncbi:MAG: acetate--CoA ligase family protein [Chloroflexi bacterium]|nr:acetate--CoA ligase family protein [Chloroflexota bacterium]MBI3340949.1 acetate--CoA ligase family protein [Chloroflexota bacterium]